MKSILLRGDTYKDLQDKLKKYEDTHNFSSVTMNGVFFMVTVSPRPEMTQLKDLSEKLKDSLSNVTKDFGNIDINSIIKTSKNGR